MFDPADFFYLVHGFVAINTASVAPPESDVRAQVTERPFVILDDDGDPLTSPEPGWAYYQTTSTPFGWVYLAKRAVSSFTFFNPASSPESGYLPRVDVENLPAAPLTPPRFSEVAAFGDGGGQSYPEPGEDNDIVAREVVELGLLRPIPDEALYLATHHEGSNSVGTDFTPLSSIILIFTDDDPLA